MKPKSHHLRPLHPLGPNADGREDERTALTCLRGSPSQGREPPGTGVWGWRDSPLQRQLKRLILSGSSGSWLSLPSWGGDLGPLRMRSGGRRRRRRWRRGSYLGKVAHPPHPACDAGEEGRSLSQPGVVSSPLGESPSPPSWILREWRAPPVRRGPARRGSALFHCLGARKLRGQLSPLPTGCGPLPLLPPGCPLLL